MSRKSKVRLALKLTAIALMVGGGFAATQTAGSAKIVALAAGLAGLATFIVLTVFSGGGDPDKQPGLNPPPLRWGGGN